MRIAEVVQRSDTPAGRAFDATILALIIYSIFTLSVETLPDLPESIGDLLDFSEAIVTVLFTIEYVLRIGTSEKPLKYIFSFLGIIDLLAIVPFYLALGIDLRGVRAFRLFRIFRLLKLARYSRALNRFTKALAMIREEIVLFFLAASLVLFLSSVGIYYFEHDAQPANFKSIPHSMWWAVVTLTTVGYGDVYPITPGGKVFTFFVLMIGLGIVAVPAGLMASALTKVRENEHEI